MSRGSEMATRQGQGQGQVQAPAGAGMRKSFVAALEESREGIAALLHDPRKVDRVIRMARTAWQLSPDLQRCKPESVLAAVMKAAELDLDPGGALQHCYLIPYAGECQFQIGYRGYVELAMRSGKFRAIEARCVHARDVFELQYNPEPVFDHRPCLDADRGPMTHAYAYARMAGGDLITEVMTAAEVELVRTRSKSGPVWKTWPEEMAKKTPLKRMLKRQSLSPALARAAEFDAEAERQAEAMAGMGAGVGVGAVQPRGVSRAEAMARALEGPGEDATEESQPTEGGEDPDGDFEETEAGARG